MSQKMSRRQVWVGLIAVAFCLPVSADTVSLDFSLISSNTSAGGGTAPSQFSVDVSWGADAPEAGRVGFEFFNSDTDGVITDIYWESQYPNPEPLDYSTWGSDNSTTATVPTDWFALASPSELPGGPSSFDAAFSADSDPPPVHKGIHSGESALFLIDLIGSDPSAFANAILSGALRLGIRVQSIDGGLGGDDNPFSESYITTIVPVPPALSLIVIGMGSLLIGRRRRIRA